MTWPGRAGSSRATPLPRAREESEARRAFSSANRSDARGGRKVTHLTRAARRAWQSRDVPTRLYAPPGDLIRLTTDQEWAFDLAGRMWEEKDSAPDPLGTAAIEIVVRSEEDEEARPSPRPGDFLEGELRWEHGEAEFRCEVPGALAATIDLTRARVEARVEAHLAARIAASLPLPSSPSRKSSSSFPSSSSSSLSLLSFLSRTLLEAPAAVLLGRRGWQVLHAGAVLGPRGAAVLRGPSGAGKSTLVAALHAAGLSVLGDESLFVSRRDPDDLSASVRDLCLREDSARLLGIFRSTTPAFTGREAKRRVELFNGSTPASRRAPRVATILLGPRDPGTARLSPLRGDAFVRAFAEGGIPQERPGDPEAAARAWARDGILLSGAQDLRRAVGLVKEILT